MLLLVLFLLHCFQHSLTKMMKEMEGFGEFWLPADFLSDDFFVDKNRGDGSKPCSPVEPVNGAESENEDDCIAGITHRIANSFLHEDSSDNRVFSAFARDNSKPTVMATSPRSTLCGIGSWSFLSNGGPEGPSHVSSPPSTPFPPQRDDALDLLYSAAGEVARLGLNDEHGSFYGPLTTMENQKTGLESNQALTQQQQQAFRFYQLKRQQLMKQQWGRLNRSRSGYGDEMGPLGFSNSPRSPLQKHQQHQVRHDPGTRAVYLNGGRRESKGTGVFLPRRIGAPNEPRKKPACSSFPVPATVIKALNLNPDDGTVHQRVPGAYFLDQETVWARGTELQAQGKLNRLCPPSAVCSVRDVRLPTEWTY